ncbi:MAG: molecular chaperone TorD family protein [Chloroflexi bacterium]|nr:molecular chaperone TorD family protein [Chloroflexota bacterium]
MTINDTLMARATLWSWVARAFAYPLPALEQALSDPAGRTRLALLAESADETGALGPLLEAVWQAVDLPDASNVSLTEEHTFLFGRHVRVPPYESSYVLQRGADRSTHLSEIGGLYAAFGLSIAEDAPEMPDHLGAECELLAVLLMKEAYAREEGWSGRAKLTRHARRKLIAEHLQLWLPTFVERLDKHHRRTFYPAVGALLLRLLELEEAQLNTARPAPIEAAEPVSDEGVQQSPVDAPWPSMAECAGSASR